MHIYIFCLLIANLLWSISASGFADKFKETCAALANSLPPALDQPSAQEKEKLKGFVSQDLYFGIGMPKDAVAARKCAFGEIGKHDAMGGEAILMMIYANGDGVPRNYDLAMHYACLLDAAPAEMEARLSHLAKLKEAYKKVQTCSSCKFEEAPFHVCQDITSGLMGGVCAAHEKRMSDVTRKTRLNGLEGRVSSQNKALFAELRSAEDEFVNARVANEVDLSGTARTQMQIDEQMILEEDFAQMLERFVAGKPNIYSESQLREREKKLETLLAGLKPSDTWGTVTVPGIRKTQEKWVAYRDAFAHFASEEFKGVKDFSVRAWLTAKRLQMLKHLTK